MSTQLHPVRALGARVYCVYETHRSNSGVGPPSACVPSAPAPPSPEPPRDGEPPRYLRYRTVVMSWALLWKWPGMLMVMCLCAKTGLVRAHAVNDGSM